MFLTRCYYLQQCIKLILSQKCSLFIYFKTLILLNILCCSTNIAPELCEGCIRRKFLHLSSLCIIGALANTIYYSSGLSLCLRFAIFQAPASSSYRSTQLSVC